MRTKHIAFLAFPHWPHVLPTLSIVSALTRRGYRVTYVVPELFESRVRDVGGEVVRGPHFIDVTSDGQPIFGDLCTLADQAIDNITVFYEKNKPDLIIYDRAFLAGRILAQQFGILAATTTAVLAFELANPELLDESSRKWRDSLKNYNNRVDLFLQQRGIADARTFFHKEDLNIHLFPRVYQLAGSVLDERDFYAGRSAAEAPYCGRWRPRDDCLEVVILVSTSTAYLPGPRYFQMCIEALSEVSAHILLLIGDRMNRRIFDPLPQNFEIVQNVPQIKLLPYVNLFICKAGPASASEAMYHGIPLLMITHGDIDSASYAENAVRLGMGIHLPGAEITAEKIERAVREMLENKTFANRMKRLSSMVRREAGGEETANRIEQYLAKGSA